MKDPTPSRGDRAARVSLVLGLASACFFFFTGVPAIVLGVRALHDPTTTRRAPAGLGIFLGAAMSLAALAGMLREPAPPKPARNDVGVALPAGAVPMPGPPGAGPLRSDFTEVPGSLEDLSLPTRRRVANKIVIPLGRSREEVEQTLRGAAWALCLRERARGCMVNAYRPGDPTDGGFTVGQGVYAPFGRWDQIFDAPDAAPMLATTTVGKLYFKAPDPDAPGSGEGVRLRSADGDTIFVSRRADRWLDEDRVGRVPLGSRAEVLERRALGVTADVELVRYRVRVGGVEGWVWSEDIEREVRR